MSTWKKQLKEIVETAEAAGTRPKAEGRRVTGFLGDVVVPAFEMFAQQLQDLERDVELDLGDRKAQIRVLRDGTEEFFFEVRIRAYRKRDFAFPVIPLRDSEGELYRAEASIRSGELFHDLTDYSTEGLLDVLVTEYGRHLRWER